MDDLTQAENQKGTKVYNSQINAIPLKKTRNIFSGLARMGGTGEATFSALGGSWQTDNICGAWIVPGAQPFDR